MATRVLTTKPAGHTVSKFDDDLTSDQVAEVYREFYDSVVIIHKDNTIPTCDYLECSGAKNYQGIATEPHLYLIRKD